MPNNPLKKNVMKTTILVLVFFLSLVGCKRDDTEYIDVNGKVERELTGQGIPDQEVFLSAEVYHGTGMLAYKTLVDSKVVRTDANGQFSMAMKSVPEMFVTASTDQDENQTGSQKVVYGDALLNPIILQTNKIAKFKVYVKSINPFDDNDKINIDFFGGNQQTFRTAIQNFGVENIKHPAENSPGGGSTAAWEETTWVGANVNSVISYNVPENADQLKIIWKKRKNGTETTGSTADIPFVVDQMNEYHFDY